MVGSQSQYFMNALQRSKHWTPFSSAAVFATIAYCRAWLTSRVSESESCSLIGAGVTTILLEQHISPTFPPGPLKPKSRFVRMSGFVVNEATTSDQIQLSATAASSRGRIWPVAGFMEVTGSKDTRFLPIRVPQLVRTLEMAIVLSPINVHSSILVCIRVKLAVVFDCPSFRRRPQ